MNRRAISLAFSLTLLFTAHASAAKRPRNVILFIGDGMGPSHVTAMSLIRGAAFATGTMPVTGFVKTQSANKMITDSAAAGTALATGTKTNNGMLSVTPNGARLLTVLEQAEKSGKATGLVTTAAFFDATPAAFSAHVPERHAYGEIASQMVRSGAEVLIGTGLVEFAKPGMPSLPQLARDNGYTLTQSRAELDAAHGAKLLAVFHEQTNDLDTPEAPLPDLTRIAIDRLSRDRDGFFLLVEHEGTDSSSHNNASADVAKSLISLDKAVAVALDWARQHRDTLVIVTADHETGALRLLQTKENELQMEWGSDNHTAVAVPIFAFGPGSAEFEGFMDNTDVGRKLLAIETRGNLVKR